MTEALTTLELIAWDLDTYAFRPHALDPFQAQHSLKERPSRERASALLADGVSQLRDALDLQSTRPDLEAEMRDLDWHLGVVDLRILIAFQRRLTFNPTVAPLAVPDPADWEALLQIAFAQPNSISYKSTQQGNTITFRSPNPNLHLRPTQDPVCPLEIHAGSPFFEVALYRDRWFLRDGYHRAYTLLQAGIFHLPAVIVNARTIEELGATKPRFFSEEILFSTRPPMVTDFLDPALTTTYTRPPTITTIYVSWEETVAPAGDLT